MLRVTLTVFIFLISAPVAWAEDDFEQRLELAEQMLDIRPARVQLESALDQYIANYMFNQPDHEQKIFRSAMLNVMNHKALNKIAVDAYAETFTVEELVAMVEYYAKPEAQSARKKQGELNRKISPEIIHMLDQALMRIRAEGP